jgi:NAD(P)-dependent dehydrogenase (short-subunit alcohol dehydrogenase family)
VSHDELKEFNIQVNAIAPGIVNTRMIDDILAAGEDAGPQAITEAKHCKETGGTPPQKAADLVVFLSSSDSNGQTGRLISALWDDRSEMVRQFPKVSEIGAYTLRRLDQHTLSSINPNWILLGEKP